MSAKNISEPARDISDESAKPPRSGGGNSLAEHEAELELREVQRARTQAALRMGSPVSAQELTDQIAQAKQQGQTDGDSTSYQLLPEGRFLDRELSWLGFNERVLEQAEDQTLPILERAWFLAIFASNLDEFYMVRVAGLSTKISRGKILDVTSEDSWIKVNNLL